MIAPSSWSWAADASPSQLPPSESPDTSAGCGPVVVLLFAVPRPLRDLAYDWIARSRYKWFGVWTSCRIPTLALTRRFVDGEGVAHSPASIREPAAAEPTGLVPTAEQTSLALGVMEAERRRVVLLVSFVHSKHFQTRRTARNRRDSTGEPN